MSSDGHNCTRCVLVRKDPKQAGASPARNAKHKAACGEEASNLDTRVSVGYGPLFFELDENG